MNKIITILISASSFFASSHVLALSQATVPAPMSVITQATMPVSVQILAKKEGGKKEKKFKEGKQNKKLKKEEKLKKEKKLNGDHKNKVKHKGHDNNEHSNAGDGKLHGLDRADESAGEHSHRDKVRSNGKPKKTSQ
jgi:hypothetical protein